MAAGEVVGVTATADAISVTLTMTDTRVLLSAPTLDEGDPGAIILSVPEHLVHRDGLSVLIPVEE